MDGLEFLTRIRRAGKRPARVYVMVCKEPQPPFWKWSDFCRIDIHVPAQMKSVRMDWRPVMGCDVTVIADQKSDALRALVSRLTEFAETMTVSIISEIGEHSAGHFFARGHGWRAI